MRTFDSNYSDWKIGDKVVWCDKQDICPLFTITEINAGSRWVFWEDSGRRQGSQYENIVRVTETSKEGMTDLEKFINDLCELPPTVFEGNEASEVHYAIYSDSEQPFVVLENWRCDIALDPGQALSLLSWLQGQKENLTILLDALQSKRVEEEATRELRAAERLNALKALHSDAVVAWQKAGCEGPCPSFEDIVRREQFIRIDLFGGSDESIPVTFVKQFPMLERLRKEQRG